MPHVLYGGDYNPEQWPEAVWHEDARLMAEAGVNLVTVGVFAWSALEPAPGVYEFAWLDRVLGILADHGVAVDLATATASPPPWLARVSPETLPVTADGVTLWPGSRQHWCPSAPAYRDAAVALTRQLAQRYGDHPALAMWHVGNEFGCHVASCWCDTSAAAFRDWLGRRYGTLDRLNEAWGTNVWSQRYGDWQEILPPRRTPTFPNPTQVLDFRRFSSDALLECFLAEREVLREATPGVPVTTNFFSPMPLDYWRWAREQDVVSFDSYPDPAVPDSHQDAALWYDLMRSLGDGRPWMLMEQATGRLNWRQRNAGKPPGRMHSDSLQAVARGADAVMFFQWRAAKVGAERFHSGMVPHEGTASRTWREVKELGAALQRLDDVLGARVPAAVAIALDWDSWWALEAYGHPDNDLRQMELVSGWYRALFAANVTVDFVHPGANLSGYRVVLAPNLYAVSDDTAANVAEFVAAGGTLVLGFFSGVVDEHDHVRLGGAPAPFTKLLGIEVEESTIHVQDDENAVVMAGTTYACSTWSDVIALDGAEAVATFARGWYAGRPAVTRHPFGDGTAWYVGTIPAADLLARLLAQVCEQAGVDPVLRTPQGVEAVRRRRDGHSFLFLLNHAGERVDVALPAPCRSLLDDGAPRERASLDPGGVAVFEELDPDLPERGAGTRPQTGA